MASVCGPAPGTAERQEGANLDLWPPGLSGQPSASHHDALEHLPGALPQEHLPRSTSLEHLPGAPPWSTSPEHLHSLPAGCQQVGGRRAGRCLRGPGWGAVSGTARFSRADSPSGNGPPASRPRTPPRQEDTRPRAVGGAPHLSPGPQHRLLKSDGQAEAGSPWK